MSGDFETDIVFYQCDPNSDGARKMVPWSFGYISLYYAGCPAMQEKGDGVHERRGMTEYPTGDDVGYGEGYGPLEFSFYELYLNGSGESNSVTMLDIAMCNMDDFIVWSATEELS